MNRSRTQRGGRDRLWAPWRSEYLLASRRERRCIFCVAKRATTDRKHHVIERGQAVFALLNRYPYTNGHLMVAPYRHVGTLMAMEPAEWNELFEMMQRLTQRLHDALRPHGFNIGMNLGRGAGAGIPGHLHLHLVPRWHGDTNFMPVIADTRVVSQALDELYQRLTARDRGRAR